MVQLGFGSNGGGGGSPNFIKGAIVFSITVMILMTSAIALFVTPYDETVQAESSGLEDELNFLNNKYIDLTGSKPTAEMIWGLTGIYTAFGTDVSGNPTDTYFRTDDGWLSSGMVSTYHPSQMDGLNSGAYDYTVQKDAKTGLYYYTQHGSGLGGVTDGSSAEPRNGGTLYSNVHMDITKKSSKFFTAGGKTTSGDSFYYDFTGYRYTFQPLLDFYLNSTTPVTHTNTSLSLIWYQYTVDSGIAGQLVLSGTDEGLNYITGAQIVRAFDANTSTSKFNMTFNGVPLNIYIHLDPWAISHGFDVQSCYDNGFWDVFVTSPNYTPPSGSGGQINGSDFSFDAGRLVDITVGLLTFDGDRYGLEGPASIVASLIFTVSLYATLIALSIISPMFLVIAGIVALISSATAFIDGLDIAFDWPEMPSFDWPWD